MPITDHKRLIDDSSGELQMHQGELQVFGGMRRGYEIQCLEGRIWGTIEGLPEDFLIAEGQRLSVPAESKVVLQSLSAEARVSVAPKAPEDCDGCGWIGRLLCWVVGSARSTMRGPILWMVPRSNVARDDE